MSKEPKVFLAHILDSIDFVFEYAKNLSADDFQRSTEKQDAVMRRIEIIGEAVKNLPDDFKAQHPEIPWKQIAGTRDNLIHEYFGVDPRTVWSIITDDLPKLREQINDLLRRAS